MSQPTASTPPLPPFCSLGTDLLPQAPPPGTPESAALAAWEVLTGARVARSTGSGRMSLLGKYRGAGALDKERVLWIALHPFEGAEERWACRRARSPAMSDAALAAAVVQEMGGPVEEPDEMTTLGFWEGDVGFYFDCHGPSVVMTGLPGGQRRRIGRAGLLAAARRILNIPAAPGTGPAAEPAAARARRGHVAPGSEDGPALQLSLL